ncbi:hypothetical protein D9M72_509380 [compost metagenome]
MLEAAFRRPAHFVHHPVCPVVEQRLPAGIPGFGPENREAEHRRGRVDVEFRKPGSKASFVPAFDKLTDVLAAGKQPELDQAIEANTLRPFPAVEADVVACGPVEVRFIEPAVMLETGHAADKTIETRANIVGVEAHGTPPP